MCSAHPSHRGVAAPTAMYTGTDGGIATSNDGGLAWNPINGSIATNLFRGIDIGKGSPNNAYTYGAARIRAQAAIAQPILQVDGMPELTATAGLSLSTRQIPPLSTASTMSPSSSPRTRGPRGWPTMTRRLLSGTD